MFLNGKYTDIDTLLFQLETKNVLKVRNGVNRTVDLGVSVDKVCVFHVGLVLQVGKIFEVN
jgi:hypothetical protein